MEGNPDLVQIQIDDEINENMSNSGSLGIPEREKVVLKITNLDEN